MGRQNLDLNMSKLPQYLPSLVCLCYLSEPAALVLYQPVLLLLPADPPLQDSLGMPSNLYLVLLGGSLDPEGPVPETAAMVLHLGYFFANVPGLSP